MNQHPILDEITLRGLARSLDCDRHFSISPSIRGYKGNAVQFKFQVAFRQMKKFSVLVDEFMSTGYGTVYTFQDNMLTWEISKLDDTLSFAKLIQPHLAAKGDICLKFIGALETWLSGTRFTSGNKHPETHSKEDILKIVNIAWDLNGLSEKQRANKTERYQKIYEQIEEFYNGPAPTKAPVYTYLEPDLNIPDLNISYIAGIFDSTKFHTYEDRIEVGLRGPVSLPVLQSLRNMFNGEVIKVINGVYLWRLNKPESDKVLEQINPYRHLPNNSLPMGE